MLLFKDMSLTTIESGDEALSVIEIKGTDGETVRIGIPKSGLQGMAFFLLERVGDTYQKTNVTDDVMYQ